MLCLLPPYNNMSHTYILFLLNLPLIPHCIPPFQVVTEHLVDLPVLSSNFSLAIYFIYGNVYGSMLLSQFVPLFPTPTESTSLFSTSASLLLPCKQVLQYHFSRFHVYALLYNICFSLSGLLHSVSQVHPPHQN